MLTTALAAFGVAVLASFAQSVSGFGFALVAVPLLAAVVDVRSAVVGVTLLGLCLTVGASIRYRREVVWPMAKTMTIGAVVGMPFGLIALVWIDQQWLALCIAVLVLIFAAASMRKPSRAGGHYALVGAGVLGGLFLTSAGMNGPPMVAALQAKHLEPREFRATLQGTFAAQDVIAVAGFAVVGQLGLIPLTIMVGGLLGIPIGWVIGNLVFVRLSSRTLRLVVFFVLLASAATLLVQSMGR